MKSKNSVIDGLGTTIFTTMSALANKYNAINLGQGLPADDGPRELLEKAAEFTLKGPNQYPPSQGVPELRQAVAACNARFYGLSVDWSSQVLVTSGATEALTDSLLALLNPGDEVVLIEPYYDSYLPIIKLAGATPRFVRLHAPDWHLDEDELRTACGPLTKAIIINSPMNPTGKVFTMEDLQIVARIVEEFNLYAICDEVYEHLVFDGKPHIPLMGLPGMLDRCVRIGSAGKTFSVTGWKVGYITGAPHLIEAISKAHQFMTFTTPPSLQRAVAWGLAQDDAWYEALSDPLENKRNRLSAGLQQLGFETMPCGGSYFVSTSIDKLGFKGTDEEFCRYIIEKAGVAAIPLSPFYGAEPATRYVRFCFSKDEGTLDEAIHRLGRLF